MKVSSLLIMAVLHFVAMYVLMYSMVNTVNNVLPNLNNFYMAGLMTAPMLIIESIMMRSMYEDKKGLNIIMGSSVFLLLLFFLFIRQQTAIGDKEFLRSMIPHHSGAILMCNKANIQDQGIKDLCQQIIVSQQEEINIMKRKLEEFQ